MPGQAGPDRYGPDRGRPDAAWQEARWQEENRPPDRPAGGSAGRGPQPDPRRAWPESEPQSWPSQQPSSWSTGGQQSAWSGQDQPGSRGGSDQSSWGSGQGGAAGGRDYQQGARQDGWPGPPDSLEPLPSAEVHHNGPPHGQGDRSRRRWPAPDRDDPEERDAW
jgi:hypothetical protein